MSDIDRIERLLREVPAPVDPPGRLVPAIAVMAAAAAATFVIGVGGKTTPWPVASTVVLHGAGSASAIVDFGKPSGGTRPIVMHVRGLAPAPAGHYYEMWARISTENVSLVTFNTGRDGTATINAALPAGMSWRSCWITLERLGGRRGGTVMWAT
jgi:hypothetical protein